MSEHNYELPSNKPLTLAAYTADEVPTANVEPIVLGIDLPEMLLFLDPGHYVNVPLESTCMSAWDGFPKRLKRVIEGG